MDKGDRGVDFGLDSNAMKKKTIRARTSVANITCYADRLPRYVIASNHMDDGDSLPGGHALAGFQLAQLFVQVCKSLPQQLLVARISAGFELLKHPLSGERYALFFAAEGSCLGTEPRTWGGRLFIRLRLLCFNRFAFPSSCHFDNYSSLPAGPRSPRQKCNVKKR